MHLVALQSAALARLVSVGYIFGASLMMKPRENADAPSLGAFCF
jgi:hypothetical protein